MTNEVNIRKKILRFDLMFDVGVKGYEYVNNELIEYVCTNVKIERTAEYDYDHIQDIDEITYEFNNEVKIEHSKCDVFRTKEEARAAWYYMHVNDEQMYETKTEYIRTADVYVVDKKQLYYQQLMRMVEMNISRIIYNMTFYTQRHHACKVEYCTDDEEYENVWHDDLNTDEYCIFSTKDLCIQDIIKTYKEEITKIK